MRVRASSEMRGFIAVVVRAHSGTTYGFLATAGVGEGSGVGTDAVALDVVLPGAAWAVFGGEGKAAATRALRAAKRSALGRGVCVDTGLLETGSESNGRDRNVSLRCGGELSQ